MASDPDARGIDPPSTTPERSRPEGSRFLGSENAQPLRSSRARAGFAAPRYAVRYGSWVPVVAITSTPSALAAWRRAAVVGSGTKSEYQSRSTTFPPSAQNSATKPAADSQPGYQSSATTTARRQPRSRKAYVPRPAVVWAPVGAKRNRLGGGSRSDDSCDPISDARNVTLGNRLARSRNTMFSAPPIGPTTTSTPSTSMSRRVVRTSLWG